MYQHPAALDLNASHYQHEALNEAENRRLAREAHLTPEQHTSTSPFQRRMVAVAVALVSLLGVTVVLI